MTFVVDFVFAGARLIVGFLFDVFAVAIVVYLFFLC